MAKDLILFGMQGSGKGTVGRSLADEFGMKIFETGAVLRDLSKEDSQLGDEIRNRLERGELVETSVIIEAVRDFIKKNHNEKGIIFDGIPRSIEQAEPLLNLLNEYRRKYLAFHLEIDEETAMKRLTTRKMCKVCNAIYPADYSNETCNKGQCNGELFTRTDDVPDTIQRRIDVYKKETIPAMNLFSENLLEMDGRPPIEPVREDAIKLLRPYLSDEEESDKNS